MRYAIIGTGAVGGYFGAKLAKAGFGVHFLLHSDYDFVRENGIQVDSCNGSFHLDNPNVYCKTEDMPECDVIIVALKTTNNHLLKELLPPLLEHGTACGCGAQGGSEGKRHPLILLIQNGIGVEADVQQMFPGEYLAAGLAYICSAKTKPGLICHEFYGNVNIGNYSCEDKNLISSLISELEQAGIGAAEIEYDEARWKKAVWNMPFNGMTVALNTQTDRLLADEKTKQLIYDQMMEVIGAAQALGVKNIDSTFADKMIANTLEMIPYSPSMKVDYDFHRKMEIYYLYTRPIEEARKAGFAMPKMEMLEAELMFLEKR